MSADRGNLASDSISVYLKQKAIFPVLVNAFLKGLTIQKNKSLPKKKFIFTDCILTLKLCKRTNFLFK